MKSKANFFVDPEFPIIDGVGHADKQAYTNVKGGGCTNTTMYDPVSAGGHVFTSWLDRRAIFPVSNVAGSVSYVNNAVDPTRSVPSVASPGALNCIPVGDALYSRASDRIVLDRVVVNGSVSRAGGVWSDPDGIITCGYLHNQYDPKCFLALVCDKRPDGGVFDPDFCFDNAQSYSVTVGGDSPPWLDHNWLGRYQVLAHEVLDFTDPPPLAVPLVNQFLFDSVTWQRTDSYTNYVYRPVTKGFRFDVDLRGALCSFNGSSGTYTDLVDCALHMVAIWFDGYDNTAYTILTHQNLGIEYQSRVFFRDFLSPLSFVPAGADGGVVADESPDLDVLADQSAILAGLPALPDSPVRRPRKKTKASEGYYNFRSPSGEAGMLFPDDPEVAGLRDPGTRGSGRPPWHKKPRRRGQFRDKDARPFDDFLGDDWNDPRRGF